MNKILGCDTTGCSRDNFKWGALAVGIDYYDESIEVVRPPDSEWMSTDQSTAILALGFSTVFESIGEKARRISAFGFSECSPLLPSEELRLRAEIAAYKKELNNPQPARTGLMLENKNSDTMKKPIDTHFTIYKTKGQYYWHAKRRGRIIADALLSTHQACKESMDQFIASIRKGSYAITDDCA